MPKGPAGIRRETSRLQLVRAGTIAARKAAAAGKAAGKKKRDKKKRDKKKKLTYEPALKLTPPELKLTPLAVTSPDFSPPGLTSAKRLREEENDDVVVVKDKRVRRVRFDVQRKTKTEGPSVGGPWVDKNGWEYSAGLQRTQLNHLTEDAMVKLCASLTLLPGAADVGAEVAKGDLDALAPVHSVQALNAVDPEVEHPQNFLQCRSLARKEQGYRDEPARWFYP